MKTIIYLCLALFALSAVAQSPYDTGMKKAFDLWGENKMVEASNLFVSQVNVIKSFGETDPAVLKAQMDKALDFLNQLKTLTEDDNPYVKILEGQYYTAWIASDGMKYGMKYAGKVSTLYAEALSLAPENPIVVFGKAEWDAGTAKYFGQSMEPFCKDVQRAIDLSDNFEPEGAFYPSFQKERALEFIEENCKE
jgi:hypothetical protein